jgi:thiamine biosynthesis lipoprotein
VLALLLAGCADGPAEMRLSGPTMGTTWSLTYVAEGVDVSVEAVQARIELTLEAVNASMSTYRDDAEITRFNRAAAGSWHSVSRDFDAVLAAAEAVGEASGGAYDVTVAPLVELWGFGSMTMAPAPPAPGAIEEARARVGQGRLARHPENGALQQPGGLALDFSSIAKGYAVDRLAEELAAMGIGRYLLEVGGEMRLAGLSTRGDAWRIAVEEPSSAGRSVAAVLALTDRAVATSGDYRNYFEHEGRRYSHAIDPRTGYPVLHDLVSVTVVHQSAMLADAWATALIVLGEEALAVAQEQALAVYFIRRSAAGLSHSYTASMAGYLAQVPEGAVSGEVL